MAVCVLVIVIIVAMCMLMIVIIVAVYMLMIVIVMGVHRETVRMQISHIMIMILMLRIKHNVKITGIQRGLLHAADLHPGTFQMKTLQRVHKNIPVGAKIKQRRNRHVATDTAGAVQYQSFFIYSIHISFSPLYHL